MLPAIFAAISGAIELVDIGKKVYEEVAGEPSKATDAAELQAEVEALPADRQQAFVAKTQAEIDKYRAETDRLQNEQGELTPELLQTLDPETRKKVAEYRMTTRPWTVRVMVWVILAPVLAMANDALVLWVQAVAKLNGAQVELPMLARTMFAIDTTYYSIYSEASGAAMAIVMTYMLLHTLEKRGGDIITQVSGMLSGLTGLFRRGGK
jgi:hypothetical protein